MNRSHLLSYVSGLVLLSACEGDATTEVYSSERRTSRAIASSDANGDVSHADLGEGEEEDDGGSLPNEPDIVLPPDTQNPSDTSVADTTPSDATDVSDTPDTTEPVDVSDVADTPDTTEPLDVADITDTSEDVPDTSDVSDVSDSSDTNPGTVAKRVCFAGEGNTWDLCYNLVPISQAGSGYNYPTSSDTRYRKPEYVLDLQNLDLSVKVAPNFRMSEFLSISKGRYAILSPQAVQRLQQVRNGLGTVLNVNSGYRNVSYNASIGGATFSRHMYGDGFDVQNNSATTLQKIADQCTAKGAAYTQLYTTHVHCDWRSTPLPADFWSSGYVGPLAYVMPWPTDDHDHGPQEGDPWLSTWGDVTASLSADGTEWILEAHWRGFDEGIPWVSWQIQHSDLTQQIEPSTSIRIPVGAQTQISWSISGLVEGHLTVD